ncbi:MAG TPA: hypothetical protein PLD27_04340 [bacterium]|nr:hypothetical protein [bacterium]HOL47370.1 hypothetical protein [bacterium]HPQ18897.1 hypothetical protein [bacterium]
MKYKIFILLFLLIVNLYSEDTPIILNFNYNLIFGNDIQLFQFSNFTYEDNKKDIKKIIPKRIIKNKPEIDELIIQQLDFEKEINYYFNDVENKLDFYLAYLYYPEDNYFPLLKKLDFTYEINKRVNNFEIEKFDFKNFFYFPINSKILSNVIIRNNDRIVISYKEKVKNKFAINIFKTEFLGGIEFEVLTKNKQEKIPFATIKIINTLNEPIKIVKADENGKTSFLKDEILLFDNSNDKPYYIEVYNQGQKIKEDKLHIVANRHKSITTCSIITDQEPLSFYVGKKVKIKGRVLYQDIYEKIKPVQETKIKLYDEEVGLTDIYSTNFERNFLAETYTNSDGEFEFKEIVNYDGKYKDTIDAIIILELETKDSKMINTYLGTDIVYRINIYKQENIWPIENEYCTNDIIITEENKDYDKYLLFQLINESYKKEKIDWFRKANKLQIVYPFLQLKNLEFTSFNYQSTENILRISKQIGDKILKTGSAEKFLLFQ